MSTRRNRSRPDSDRAPNTSVQTEAKRRVLASHHPHWRQALRRGVARAEDNPVRAWESPV